MKNLLLLLVSSLIIYATDYSNEGKQQNEYGYYGAGVVFGGYEIVGKWYIDVTPMTFEDNGTALIDGNYYAIYSVNETGSELVLHKSITHYYTFKINGNEGCFIAIESDNGDFQPSEWPINLCKANVGNKTFGPASTGVDITVGER